jgi:hypothetical protein
MAGALSDIESARFVFGKGFPATAVSGTKLVRQILAES